MQPEELDKPLAFEPLEFPEQTTQAEQPEQAGQAEQAERAELSLAPVEFTLSAPDETTGPLKRSSEFTDALEVVGVAAATTVTNAEDSADTVSTADTVDSVDSVSPATAALPADFDFRDFADFELASPPPFPHAPVPDAAALNALHAIEQAMQATPCSLPEAPVSDFPAPMMTVMYSPHQLTLDAARSALTTTLTPLLAKLPRGVKLDALSASLRPVFIPRWYLQGEISADWQANGVEISSWEIECPQCYGSGKRGVGVNQKDCESCWGSGKEKQTTRKKHAASGSDSVALTESLDNHDCGLDLQLSARHDSEPMLLPDEERMRLQCLRPASIYSSDALDAFKNRLATRLETQAKDTLSQYSRVDDFLFEPDSVRSHSAVAAWLYPIYLGWSEAQGGRLHVLCDALTGEVSWGQAKSDSAAAADGSGEGRSLPTLIVGLAAALAVAAAVWFWLQH